MIEETSDFENEIKEVGAGNAVTHTISGIERDVDFIVDDNKVSKRKITKFPSDPSEPRRWYSLRVISGKEKKIKERIDMELNREDSPWLGAVFQAVVPTEKVYKMRNGKKAAHERNLLPGYILIEAYGSLLNGEVAKSISDIPNVIHFLGKETPLPMTLAEAHRLLGIVDDSSEAGESLSEPFIIGESVKVIDGAFANFIGDVQKIDEEKKKLTVIVKIFGRGTEMELSFMQVEKIN